MRKNDHLPIFIDVTGRRFFRIKTTLLLLALLGVLFLAVCYQAVFGQSKNNLAKIGKDTNFTVIDKISTISEKKITVNGEGTFVTIDNNQNSDIPYTIQRHGNATRKTVILTFDDGPHPAYTPRILEILKKEGVPASFFMIGDNIFRFRDTAQMVVDAGMEVGTHTMTHLDKDYLNYSQHTGEKGIDWELNFTQNLIETLGVKATLFRSPYWGADNDITLNSLGLTTYALDKGYTVSAPTADSNDWQAGPVDRIIKDSISNDTQTVVLLLHDAGGYRENTVLALPKIIEHFKKAGYDFTTLGALKGENFNPTPNLWESVSSYMVVGLYSFWKAFPRLLSPILVFGLVFSLLYGLITVFLSLIEVVRRQLLLRQLKQKYDRAVTVLIPAYNEEKVIAKTVRSVLKSDYPDFKVIVIDDGSTDNTLAIVKAIHDRRLTVLHKSNGGKHSALNLGLKKVKTEFFLSIDADTVIKPSAISFMSRFFQLPDVGAVGGNVKVGNRKNLWGILQSIEYTLSLNLERNAFSLLNSILVVPGALGAWRTRVVKKVGGYWGSTMTEDAELTLRMLKSGYRVLYDKDSIAYTEAPQNFTNLVRQRFRWNYGIFQTFYLHKNLLFKKDSGILGNFILPFTIFVQIPLMLLTPVMDILALSYLLFVSLEVVKFYLIVYLIIRFTLGGLAYAINREMPWPLLFIPFVRFVYQPAMYIPLYLAVFKVLKGTRMDWHKLKRYNSVGSRKAYLTEFSETEII